MAKSVNYKMKVKNNSKINGKSSMSGPNVCDVCDRSSCVICTKGLTTIKIWLHFCCAQ